MERDKDYFKLREAFGYFGDLDPPKIKHSERSVSYDVSFTRKFDKLIGEIARQRGIDKERVIVDAIATYVYLQNELRPDPEHKEKYLVIRKGEEIITRIELP